MFGPVSNPIIIQFFGISSKTALFPIFFVNTAENGKLQKSNFNRIRNRTKILMDPSGLLTYDFVLGVFKLKG